jgi:hypothetical protein
LIVPAESGLMSPLHPFFCYQRKATGDSKNVITNAVGFAIAARIEIRIVANQIITNQFAVLGKIVYKMISNQNQNHLPEK